MKKPSEIIAEIAEEKAKTWQHLNTQNLVELPGMAALTLIDLTSLAELNGRLIVSILKYLDDQTSTLPKTR